MTTTRLRISKFRPGRHYTDQETWTSIDDIGDDFEDGKLTRDKYLEVENKYVEAAYIVWRAAGSPPLTVVAVEHAADEGVQDPGVVERGEVISGDRLGHIWRKELREEQVSRSASLDGRFAIYFGYDYYMYIRTTVSTSSVVASVEMLGLFIEEITEQRFGWDEWLTLLDESFIEAHLTASS